MGEHEAQSEVTGRLDFSCIVATPDVPATLVEALAPALRVNADHVIALDVGDDADDAVTVSNLLQRARLAVGGTRRGGAPPVLVVTSRPLVATGAGPLFGCCDRRHRIVLLSTARLGRDPSRLLTRVVNVVAHERGHLAGRRHCQTPRCVMQAVSTVAGLDARADVACGRCPTATSGRMVAAAAGLMLICSAAAFALDRVGAWMAPAPMRPFSCVADARGVQVLGFNAKVVPSPAGTRFGGGLPCADEAVEALNELFQRLDLSPLSVDTTDDGRVIVRHAELTLIEILPDRETHQPATDLGARWADEVGVLLAGKGRDAEGCPSCHVDRPADMAAARRLSTGR